MVQSVVLKNYRSYDSASFEFTDGVTIVIGPNASGKTNLLEAIYLLTQGSSFRVSDKHLIKNSQQWSRIEGVFDDSLRILKLESEDVKTKKTFDLNGIKKTRLTYDQIVPLVLFEPDDIRMVSGSPERRRRYLDALLIQTVPGYKQSLAKYQRSLRQRNTLLKKGMGAQELFAWNIILAQTATDIVNARRETTEYLNTHVTNIYNSITEKPHKVVIGYQSTVSQDGYMNTLLRELERRTTADVERGYTSVGPHRDDLILELDDSQAGTSASRGEARTLMLSLKILEMNKLADVRNCKPILLLDDVFSELDGLRRRKLTQYLRDYQSIITTTDADVVGKKFTSLAQIISL